MDNIFYSSKEQIRNKLLKTAGDYWGLTTAADFDPLVKLIIEALSTELFNISNEVADLENRMFDKVAGILASGSLVTALPAHAVIHARPLERTEIIDEKTQFFFEKKLKDPLAYNQEIKQDVFFSPLNPVKIFDARIAAVATGNSLFKIHDNLTKTLLCSALPEKNLQKNNLYVGLEIPSGLDSLEGLNFYFDWQNYRIATQLYDLLPLTRWYVGENQLKISAKRNSYPPRKDGNLLFEESDVMHLIAQDVDAFYSRRFIAIEQDFKLSSTSNTFPADFEQVFSTAALKAITVPMIWIRIEFPTGLSQTDLDELYVSINAFPVINKQLHNFSHRQQMMSDIIPLRLSGEEQFLSVGELKDNLGNNYQQIPQEESQERVSGHYSLRYGSTERFDARNAKDMLDYLFELLRDEKAAFSIYGSDFMDSTLKALEQNISILIKKTSDQPKNTRELLNYIVVKPLDAAELLFLEYWTTLADSANQIPSGTLMRSFEHSKTKPESLFLLTQSRGGRARLNRTARTQAYKYGLTTGNRIVTAADIIKFCFFEFGERISKVEVNKGLMMSVNPKEGFLSTVDVLITPAAGYQLQQQEWQGILEQTASKLTARSTLDANYRLSLHGG